MENLTYKEAQEKSLKVKWKISYCPQGEECWCRVIEPEVEIKDKDGNKIYIIGSGEVSKIHAEHIVNIHNNLVGRIYI